MCLRALFVLILAWGITWLKNELLMIGYRLCRGCCKSVLKKENVCGNSAGVSKIFLAFAGTPQAPRKTFWPLREPRKHLEKLFGLCRNAANASKNFLAFAGTLQTPRKTFWPLQERCKCHEKLFGLCRNAANATKNFLDFAGTLQTLLKSEP